MTIPSDCDVVRRVLLEGGREDWEDVAPHLASCPDCAALREAILAEEARLDQALETFAHQTDLDTALRRARDVSPRTPSWRTPLMTFVVFGSAAAALLALAPWSPPSAPIEASVGVDAATSSQHPDGGTVSAEAVPSEPREAEPSPAAPGATEPPGEPLAAEPLAAAPAARDGLAGADGAASAPGQLSACGDPDALAVAAMGGRLDDGARACLSGLLAPDSTADAAPVLRLLAVDAFAGGDMEAWERYALQLASIVEDPDLHYKLALHYAGTPGMAAMGLHHAEVALGMAERWPAELRDARVGKLLELRADAALQRFVEEPGPETKAQAAEAARDWLREVGREGKQGKAARRACEALATPGWCAEE